MSDGRSTVIIDHCFCVSGAAFVRMGAKTQALQAITALHQSQTMHVSLLPSQGFIPSHVNNTLGTQQDDCIQWKNDRNCNES